MKFSTIIHFILCASMLFMFGCFQATQFSIPQNATSTSQTTASNQSLNVPLPLLSIESLSEINYVNLANQTQFLFFGSCGEEGRSVQVFLLDLEIVDVPCTSGRWVSIVDFTKITQFPLVDGEYTITLFHSSELKGNTLELRKTFIFDSQAPATPVGLALSPNINVMLSNVNDPSIVSTTPLLQEPQGRLTVYSDGACNLVVGSGQVDSFGNLEVELLYANDGSEDGFKSFFGKFEDKAGNPSTGGCFDLLLSYTLLTIPPALSLNPPPIITNANVADYVISGGCDFVGVPLPVDITLSSGSGILTPPPPAILCSPGNIWSIPAPQNWDVSSAFDGDIVISVDYTDLAGNAASTVVGQTTKQTSLPTVSITTPVNGRYINAIEPTANAYVVSGLCSEVGRAVTVKMTDGVVMQPVMTPTCTASGNFNTWQTNFDTTGYVGGAPPKALTITAEHTNALGDMAPIATVVIYKDTVVPGAPTAVTPITRRYAYQGGPYIPTWTAPVDTDIDYYEMKACLQNDCATGCFSVVSLATSGVTGLNNNLTHNTDYYVCVRSVDIAQNQSLWTPSMFTVSKYYAPADVLGSNGPDDVVGDNTNNVLRGNLDSDFLYGMGGNDILEGGPGGDTLDGGDGDDILYGDDELFKPLDIPGLILHLDATQLLDPYDIFYSREGSVPLPGWTDLSGQNNHALLPANAVAKPFFDKGDALTGRSTVGFSGVVASTSYYEIPNLNLNDNVSVFIVFENVAQTADAGNDNRPFLASSTDPFVGGSTGYSFGLTKLGDNLVRTAIPNNGGTYADQAAFAPDSNYHVFSAISANGNLNQRVDGANDVTDSAAPPGSFDTGYLLGGGPFTQNRFTGHIAEVIIYNQSLSSDQRDQIERYLAFKWGIEFNAAQDFLKDRLTGGLGKDTFVFSGTTYSSVAQTDVITDFSFTEEDRIDLRNFPENITALIGGPTPSFTGLGRPELRWDAVACGTPPCTMIYIDISGNGTADYQIRLENIDANQFVYERDILFNGQKFVLAGTDNADTLEAPSDLGHIIMGHGGGDIIRGGDGNDTFYLDGPIFHPAMSGTLVQWLDGSHPSFVDAKKYNGYVNEWKDLSDSKVDVLGTTAMPTTQPNYEIGTIGGRRTLKFQSSDLQFLEIASSVLPANANDLSISTVFETASSTGTKVLWEQNSSVLTPKARAAFLLLSGVGGGQYGFNGQGYDAHNIGNYINNLPEMSVLVKSGNDVTLNEGGTIHPPVTVSNPGPSVLGTNFIEVGRKHAPAIEYFDGKIAEIIVHSDAITSSVRTNQLIRYFSYKYQLQPINIGDGNFNASDSVLGKGGADRFIWTNMSSSPVGKRDIINDFIPGEDKLIFLDLVPEATFVEGMGSYCGGVFTAKGYPELRCRSVSQDTVFEFDSDGDGSADHEILLEGVNSNLLSTNDLEIESDNLNVKINVATIPNAFDKEGLPGLIKDNSPYTVTIDFTKDVVGFDDSDLILTSGATILGTMTEVNPRQYTFDLDLSGVASNSVVDIEIPEGVALDPSGPYVNSRAVKEFISKSAIDLTDPSDVTFPIDGGIDPFVQGQTGTVSIPITGQTVGDVYEINCSYSSIGVRLGNINYSLLRDCANLDSLSNLSNGLFPSKVSLKENGGNIDFTWTPNYLQQGSFQFFVDIRDQYSVSSQVDFYVSVRNDYIGDNTNITFGLDPAFVEIADNVAQSPGGLFPFAQLQFGSIITDWPNINGDITLDGMLNDFSGAPWIGTGSITSPFALKFDGDMDRITVGAGSSFFTSGSDFSIEWWLRPASIVVDNNKLSGPTVNDFSFKMSACGGAFAGGLATFFDDTEIPCGSIVVGRWNHLVYTQDTLGNATFYINGQYIVSENAHNIPDFNMLNIGDASTDTINGDLAEIRIYNKELTAEEVNQSFIRTGDRLRGYSAVGDLILINGTYALTLYIDPGLGERGTNLHPINDASNCSGLVKDLYNLGLPLAPNQPGVTGVLTNFDKCDTGAGYRGVGTAGDPRYIVQDGDDDEINFGDNYDFDITDSFTYGGWYRRRDLTDVLPDILMSKRDPDTNSAGYELKYDDSTNELSVKLRSDLGNQVDVGVSNIMTDTNWHYIGFSYAGTAGNADPSLIKVFQDGEIMGTAYTAGSIPMGESIMNTNDFIIGGAMGSNFDAYIEIGPTMLYSTEIDETQIEQNFYAQANRFRNQVLDNVPAEGLKIYLDPRFNYQRMSFDNTLCNLDLYSNLAGGYAESAAQILSMPGCPGSIFVGTDTVSDPYALTFETTTNTGYLLVPETSPIAGNENIGDPTTDFSAALWIRINSSTPIGESVLVAKQQGTTSSLEFRHILDNSGNSQLAFYRLSNSLEQSTVTTDPLINSLADDSWHFVAVTYTASSTDAYTKFYVDGSLVDSFANSVDIFQNVDDYIIGNISAGGKSFDGFLGPVWIYHRALQSGEVSVLCKNYEDRYTLTSICAGP